MSEPDGAKTGESFESIAASESEPSLVAEFLDFLAHNKKWWLVPILVMLGVFGLLIALSATPIAPFIYTLF